MRHPPRPASAPRGFTLVELLVVIGIIALLIAILLPSLSKARKQAQLVKCSSNLHSIAQACLIHANDHHGYFPTAGKTWSTPNGYYASGPAVGPTGPSSLGDPSRTKYDYYKASPVPTANFVLMDMPAVVGLTLGQHIRTDSKADVAADVPLGLGGTLFTCPSDNQLTTGTTVASDVDGSVGVPSRNSYDFNEEAMGWEGDSVNVRMHSQLSRIPRPSETVLMADGNGRTNNADEIKAFSATPANPAVTANTTLADVLANANGLHNGIFDLVRHDKKVNVSFFDGHVQAFTINAADLAHAGIRVNFQ